MTKEQVTDVSSTIGNLIRISMAVTVEEAELACDAATMEALHILLLDPRAAPQSPDDDLLNRRLLEAFVRFRWQLEMLQAGDRIGGGREHA